MGILAGGIRILNEKVEFVLSSRLKTSRYGSGTKKHLKVLGAIFLTRQSRRVLCILKPRKIDSDLWLEF